MEKGEVATVPSCVIYINKIEGGIGNFLMMFMKCLFTLFIVFFVYADVFAQDTIRKIQIHTRYTNKSSFTKKISTEDAIATEIRIRLDSLANTSKGTILRLSTLRAEIEHILYPYWKSGDLKGKQSSHAYFIRTGSQTMTQMDILNGRILITVGLAIQKPAEFELLQFEQIVRTKKLVID